MCLWNLANLKSVEQASRLGTQGRVGVAVFNPKSEGQAHRWKLRQKSMQ